jgi:NADH dehydrogenase [ubiquinone] 1 alpha subcomplex assembly factor 7
MSGILELTVSPKSAPATTENVDVAALESAKPLEVEFKPFQTVLSKWEAKASALVVTDINQKTEMQQARLARLELKEARVALDKTRKGLVEGLKAKTAKIDAVARVMREKFEELEAFLLESEQFAERHAAKLKAELKVKRETELATFMETPIIGDLSDLSEDDYAKTLADAKFLKQSKIDAARKAEEERKAKEEADRIERERIAAENARLKAEAVERERLAEIERKRIEAEREEERRKAKAEADRSEAERAEERKKAEAEAKRIAEVARKEREVIEAKAKAEAAKAKAEADRLKAELEAKAKAEAEEKARIAAEEKAKRDAEKAAAAAPDKAKLKAFASTIRSLQQPTLNNADVQQGVATRIEGLAFWIESQINNL